MFKVPIGNPTPLFAALTAYLKNMQPVRGVNFSIRHDMVTEHLHGNFGSLTTSAHIMPELPDIAGIAGDFDDPSTGSGAAFFKPLVICDNNTEYLAHQLSGGASIPRCVLEAGEPHKNWQAVETILRSAHKAGLGRDGTFIGVGGGVVGDLCAFAASIYMRGVSLALVSTTLLGMVDASLGGKTGFDLFDIKNIAGTFYPARHVYMPMESLASLPWSEWKSGMAELIKTAILDGDDFVDELAAVAPGFLAGKNASLGAIDRLARCISRAARFKSGIVAEDPLEKGGRRILLNLGHTFGHALESAAGLGTISHGEAVAWGIARSCDLGLSLGVCPPQRANAIQALLKSCGYETASPHPIMGSGGAVGEAFMQALNSDKKKRGGNLTFIVPNEKSAQAVPVESNSLIDTIIMKGLSS